MSLPKRHSAGNQPLRQIGGDRRGRIGCLAHGLNVERRSRNHFGHRDEAAIDLVEGVKERLFVFLQVAVVRERKTFQRRQEPREVADQTAGFAAGELCDVGVLFLRKHRRTGRVPIAQRCEAELFGGPQHPLFADTREVHADHRESEQALCDEIAIAHRVERVGEHTGKAKSLLGITGVGRQRGAGECTRAERRNVESRYSIEQPVDIASEGPCMGTKVMRQQHGLRALKMRVTGQIRVSGVGGPAIENVDQCQHVARGRREFSFGEQPQGRGYLVVAAAGGVQFRASRAGDLGDATFDGRVNVFVARRENECTRRELALGLPKSGNDRLSFADGQHPRGAEHLGMRDGPCDVVAPQTRVKADARREGHQRVGGWLAESAVPEVLVVHVALARIVTLQSCPSRPARAAMPPVASPRTWRRPRTAACRLRQPCR